MQKLNPFYLSFRRMILKGVWNKKIIEINFEYLKFYINYIFLNGCLLKLIFN